MNNGPRPPGDRAGSGATPVADGWRSALHPLFPAFLFVVGLAVLGPWWSVYEFDTDEGLCLIKAVLVSRGHHMFSEIWSDQPPLLAMVQGTIFRFVAPDVVVGRAVVLGFAVLLLWSLYRVVEREAGTPAAWAAVAVMASSALFLRLSVSSMIGLPAVALAMLSLDLALAYGITPSRRLLWGSAAVFALSLMAKLFTLVAGPAAAVAVFMAAFRRGGVGLGVRRVFEWSAVLVATFFVLMAPFGTAAVEQLFHSHLASRGLSAFRHLGGPHHLWTLILESRQYLYLGIIGALFAALPPAFAWRARLVPVAWIAGATLGLWFHAPIWYHHLLLLHVPMAWLAGLGVGSLHQALAPAAVATRRSVRLAATAVLAIGVAASLPGIATQLRTVRHDFLTPPADADLKAVAAISAYKADTNWLLTDRPIDAVRAGILVPPWIAVFPSKRLKVREIGPDLLLSQFLEYKPEQVSFRRFYMGKPLKKYLDAHYRKVPGNPEQLHYVRPDLVPRKADLATR